MMRPTIPPRTVATVDKVDTDNGHSLNEMNPKPISFLIPTPASTKNSRRILKAGNGRMIVAKSSKAVQSIRSIKSAAVQVLQEHGWAGVGTPFGSDDLRVEIEHHVETECVMVTVSSLGPKPTKGRTGRKRDLQNLQEGILDALQGLLYDNDNQVTELIMRRTLP